MKLKYPNEPKVREVELNFNKNDLDLWGTFGAHDPSIFKDNDFYYVFSTDVLEKDLINPAIQMRKSKDLINWEYVGNVVNKVPLIAYEWTRADGIWAPEVIKVENKYYLYYCASVFGKTRSCIGLLESDSINGPWKDNGIVIKTDFKDNRNAIDPNLILDKEGRLWMAYGSFWNGIYILELNRDTGKPKFKNDFGKQIACRSHLVDGAIEGAYITYNSIFNKYYLFVSYDSLFSDYNIRVGRSDSIEGPYVDINGVEFTNINVENPNYVGNKIIGGYRFKNSSGFISPGHNSVLNDEENYYLVHHIRNAENHNKFYLNIRRIFWTDGGWPIVSPERYAGEEYQEIKKCEILGDWEIIILYRDLNRIIDSKSIVIKDNNTILGDFNGLWSLNQKDKIKIELNIANKKEVFSGNMSVAWDWEFNKPTIIITAINDIGISLWGKRTN
ncbi:arabinan endo-1,5-alpha-L-arabinosidase [Clostridium sp. Sa3CUN1]|uniref:Arabinan endo-1,5-alpha-L-arabinosidase n=1 Tax=Clostridium gallinarum TaxID=2762246 RepID=A0ABR8Q5S6_9CLOT|nr:arabinan endo-1,5-alpha-L-arabinosidase [Clostridium gallinarum]MBD7915735.1 arabinan endo-1,5-alpha-L-arabinosidase [Clostridium gallinarum]